jgi:hypothetical protein
METFQALFESQEKISDHIKALVELSGVNGAISEDKIAYIQKLALAYGFDPKNIDFDIQNSEFPQILNSFTDYKSKMCVLQDLLSLSYLDSKSSPSERAFIVLIGEKMSIPSTKVSELLDVNDEYVSVTKRLGNLIMHEEA